MRSQAAETRRGSRVDESRRFGERFGVAEVVAFGIVLSPMPVFRQDHVVDVARVQSGAVDDRLGGDVSVFFTRFALSRRCGPDLPVWVAGRRRLDSRHFARKSSVAARVLEVAVQELHVAMAIDNTSRRALQCASVGADFGFSPCDLISGQVSNRDSY